MFGSFPPTLPKQNINECKTSNTKLGGMINKWEKDVGASTYTRITAAARNTESVTNEPEPYCSREMGTWRGKQSFAWILTRRVARSKERYTMQTTRLDMTISRKLELPPFPLLFNISLPHS